MSLKNRGEGINLSSAEVNDADIEQQVEKIWRLLQAKKGEIEPERKTVLNRMRQLVKQRPTVTALLAFWEVATQSLAFANTAPEVPARGREVQLGGVRQIQKDLATGGDDFLRFDFGEESLIFQSNLEKPHSVEELGEMLLEPVTVGVGLPGNEPILHPFLEFIAGERKDELNQSFLVNLEVPYQYAEHFDKASPVDKQKMKDDLRKSVMQLMERIMPVLFGFSYKDQKERLMTGQQRSEIEKVGLKSAKVAGYASPEDDNAVDINDSSIFNQKLSELRAENAAISLKDLFKEEGLSVEDVSYQGKGEIPLTAEEMKGLKKYVYKLGKDGKKFVDDRKIQGLVSKYNKGQISDKDANELLAEVIGDKRKVAIEVEVKGRRVLLVIPAPLFLLLVPAIYTVVRSLVRRNRGRGRPVDNLDDVPRRPVGNLRDVPHPVGGPPVADGVAEQGDWY